MKHYLKQRYQDDIIPALMQSLGIDNVMEVPRLRKVVVNIGVGEALDNAKALDAAVADLTKVAGQKPIITRARKSIANFKLREGRAIGVKVTLRGERMWSFFDRLVNVALPRVRDFRGIGKGGEMRRADIYVGLGLMAVGLLVLGDAIRLGFGWGMSGPEAGFFPFYMGLGVVICTFFIVLRGIRILKKEGTGKPLIKQGGLTQILWVLIPAAGMVLFTELIGLHMATVLYLAFYMGVVGKENWIKVAVLSILVPLVVYVVFDRVFLIPLPEGLWGKNVLSLLP